MAMADILDMTDVNSVLDEDDNDSNFDDGPHSSHIDINENIGHFKTENFNVLHYNVWSLLAEGRLDFIKMICHKYSINVLVLSESKLDDKIPDNLVEINGFHEPIRRDRNRSGGGVIIYIASHLPFKHMVNMQCDHFEHIWVDIFVSGKKYCINAMYRPPNESHDDHNLFLENAELILSKVNNYPAYQHIFTGDLNYGNIYCKEPALDPKALDYLACDIFTGY